MQIDSPQWILGRAARIPGEPGWERKAEMAGLWPFAFMTLLWLVAGLAA